MIRAKASIRCQKLSVRRQELLNMAHPCQPRRWVGILTDDHRVRLDLCEGLWVEDPLTLSGCQTDNDCTYLVPPTT